MPTSNYLHLPAVAHFATRLHPSRILDVGIGLGTYGFILRQFIDVNQGHLEKGQWQTIIDGIEIFEGYRNPIWDHFYDHVHIGDALELLPKLPRYDVIICCDILEHMDLTEARGLLSHAILEEQTVIATTPNIDYPQGPWFGNAAETHRCKLEAGDFPHLIAEIRTGETTCFVCTGRSDHISILNRATLEYPSYRQDISKMLVLKIKNKFRVISRVSGRPFKRMAPNRSRSGHDRN